MPRKTEKELIVPVSFLSVDSAQCNRMLDNRVSKLSGVSYQMEMFD